ncbi:hypothetical protein [Ornithinimicrobium kibberense]|uniref:hypothetical protein n=1 Tax=Ornithinimicrobium kibberense TaxID=282060 RepID=UPI0036128EDC
MDSLWMATKMPSQATPHREPTWHRGRRPGPNSQHQHRGPQTRRRNLLNDPSSTPEHRTAQVEGAGPYRDAEGFKEALTSAPCCVTGASRAAPPRALACRDLTVLVWDR